MTDASRSTPLLTGAWRSALDLVATLALALIVATIFRVVAFQPFTIPTASMEPGLLIGDYLLVSKSAYGWTRSSLPDGRPEGEGRFLGRAVARGDVVVFRRPRDPGEVWVKRVIGLPGDEVQLRAGVVSINGRPVVQGTARWAADPAVPDGRVLALDETLAGGRRHVIHDRGRGSPGDDTPPIRVPAGQYFVMGDNRDNSLDSRWPAEVGVGLLPEANLIGKAELIVASWRPGASLFKPWTWVNLRSNRFLKPIR